MSYFNIVAATSENTVVTEFIPEPRTAEGYQSEAELEKDFINRLEDLGYEYLTIHKEDDLIINLRRQIERLNGYSFTDSEWKRFFSEHIANANEGIVEKTRTIQEDSVKNLKRDDGTTKKHHADRQKEYPQQQPASHQSVCGGYRKTAQPL